MSTGGVVYKDLHDIPDSQRNPTEQEEQQRSGLLNTPLRNILPIPHTDPTKNEGKASSLRNTPTESHALALKAAEAVPHEEKGAAQVQHENEVVDLGWNEPKEHVAKPLVGGLGNEDLWLLVRRFNKASVICKYTEVWN
jgi:hypothetical protein